MAETKRTRSLTTSASTPSAMTDALLGALARLDGLLAHAVRAAEVAYGVGFQEDRFRGLHVDVGDIDLLLGRAPAASPFQGMGERLPPSAIWTADSSHDRFGSLLELFELSPMDLDILLVALAPEIDLRYERLYAYLQDDVTRKRPSVDLILNLLTSTAAEKLASRAHFSDQAPLLRHQLLHLLEDPPSSNPPLLARYCKVDGRIVDYLLGFDHLDPLLRPWVEIRSPRTPVVEPCLPEATRGVLSRIVDDGGGAIVYLRGTYGSGRRTTAGMLADRRGRNLLTVDLTLPALLPEPEFALVCQRLVREAHLRNALLYVGNFDLLLPEAMRPRLLALAEALSGRTGVTVLAGTAPWEASEVFRDRPFYQVELAVPEVPERVRLWRRELSGFPVTAIESVAARFNFTGGQIRDAAFTAGQLARWRDFSRPRIAPDDLFEACRRHSNQKLSALARKIEPRYGWDDIVLPDDQRDQLREICQQAIHRPVVLGRWGFEKKLAYGKGLNVLFSGPPGTGKTMAAEVIAHELKLDLYQIDLSQVVSKYIGETEKNLDKIFTEARTSNAILLFDEADALFGKRSEVKDAHDRYANIETGYLLQKMEEYEGIAILATNLRGNLDEAFIRRMSFCVEFSFPQETERRLIWEKIWPAPAPRAEDLPLERLARQFEISGGNIKNIALAAAFLAVDDGGVIATTHLLRAARREYQKMGKILEDNDFRMSDGDGNLETSGERSPDA